MTKLLLRAKSPYCNNFYYRLRENGKKKGKRKRKKSADKDES